MKIAIITLALLIGVSQTTNAQHVSVRIGFPVATVIHAPGPRPYSGAIWIGPEWQWRGGNYVLVPGYWARPRSPRAVWVGGHWKHSRRGYVWVPGRWR